MRGGRARHLFNAGSAPGGPKVQDYNLAVKVTESDLVVSILGSKFRRGSADARWPGAAIAAAQQNCGDGKENARASHKAIIPNSGYDGARFSIGAASGVGDRAGAKRRSLPGIVPAIAGRPDWYSL